MITVVIRITLMTIIIIPFVMCNVTPVTKMLMSAGFVSLKIDYFCLRHSVDDVSVLYENELYMQQLCKIILILKIKIVIFTFYVVRFGWLRFNKNDDLKINLKKRKNN